MCKQNKMVIDDGIIRSFTGVEKDYVQQSREKFKSILDNKRAENENISFITSAEEFSGNPFNGFKNTKAVAENLSEVTKDFNLDIYIIVYLRRQDDFFESLYQQSIRLGGGLEFQEFKEQFDSSDFNWYSLLNAYADFFGKDKIIIRRYHREYLPNQNSLIQDFGKIIGSKTISGYQQTISRNKGFSRDTLEITRLMNKHFGEEERFKLRKIYDRVNAKPPFENYSYFSPSERESFLNMYLDSNSAILHEFLNENGNSLFPHPDYDENFSVYEGLSVEAIVVNFSKALLLVKENAERKNNELSENLKKKFLMLRIKRKVASKLDRFPKLKSSLKKLL